MRPSLVVTFILGLSPVAFGQECERVTRAGGTTCRITANETLSANFNGNIVVERDMITLNCAQRTVMAGFTLPGISVVGRTGVIVRNCVVSNSLAGFFIRNSNTMNRFEHNDVRNNRMEGFRIEQSHDNTFLRNTVSSNGRDGFDISDSNNNLFIENVVQQNGFADLTNPGNGIELDRCRNNTFQGNIADGNAQHGFSLDDSDSNVFSDNRANNNGGDGFQIVRNNDDNKFVNNRASGNGGRDADQDAMSFGNVFIDNIFVTSRRILTIPRPTIDP